MHKIVNIKNALVMDVEMNEPGLIYVVNLLHIFIL